MAKQTKEEKRIDKEVEAAYAKHGQGVQIPMMEIGSIYAAGRNAVKNNESIEEAVKAQIEKIRVN